MRKILCDICAREISKGDDLVVVAHWGVLVRPYCVECYEKQGKSCPRYSRTGSVRLNSGQMTWGLTTSLIMWAIVVTIMQGSERLWLLAVFGGAFVWMGILRAYSYIKYEKRLT